MSSQKKSSAKKGRRSSLAHTKLKLNYLPTPGADLYRSVDGNLPNEERLGTLAHVCLERTMQEIVPNVEASEVKEGLQEVSECLKMMLYDQEIKEALKQTCSGQSCSADEDSEDLELETSILKDVNRLQKEEQDWLRAVDDVEKEVEKAERRLTNLVLPEEELSEELRQLADTYLPNLEDLSIFKMTLTDACNKAFILTKENERHWHCLDQMMLETEHRLQKSSMHLHDKTFKSFELHPQEMIQHFIALPDPLEE